MDIISDIIARQNGQLHLSQYNEISSEQGKLHPEWHPVSYNLDFMQAMEFLILKERFEIFYDLLINQLHCGLLVQWTLNFEL